MRVLTIRQRCALRQPAPLSWIVDTLIVDTELLHPCKYTHVTMQPTDAIPLPNQRCKQRNSIAMMSKCIGKPMCWPWHKQAARLAARLCIKKFHCVGRSTLLLLRLALQLLSSILSANPCKRQHSAATPARAHVRFYGSAARQRAARSILQVCQLHCCLLLNRSPCRHVLLMRTGAPTRQPHPALSTQLHVGQQCAADVVHAVHDCLVGLPRHTLQQSVCRHVSKIVYHSRGHTLGLLWSLWPMLHPLRKLSAQGCANCFDVCKLLLAAKLALKQLMTAEHEASSACTVTTSTES